MNWIKNKPSKNSWLFSKPKKIPMPVKLFGDPDKDGVDTAFDCRPNNKRKQDVIGVFGGSNPLSDMYARREAARQQNVYLKQLEVEQKLADEEAKKVVAASIPPAELTPRETKWVFANAKPATNVTITKIISKGGKK
jgi:hypothetical protein